MKLHLYNAEHIGKAPEPEPSTSKASGTDESHKKTDDAIENATPPSSSDEPPQASTSKPRRKKFVRAPPPEPTPGWNKFTNTVKAGYARYKDGDENNGKRKWDPQYRGANNSGTPGYERIPQHIQNHIAGLARNNREQKVNLGTEGNPDMYTLSNSFSASVSLKQWPKNGKNPYIYHY